MFSGTCPSTNSSMLRRGCRIWDTPALEYRICCQHWSSADPTSTENKHLLFIFDESCSLVCVGLGSTTSCAACSSAIAISGICVNSYLDSATESHPSLGGHHHKRHQRSASFSLLAYPPRQQPGIRTHPEPNPIHQSAAAG